MHALPLYCFVSFLSLSLSLSEPNNKNVVLLYGQQKPAQSGGEHAVESHWQSQPQITARAPAHGIRRSAMPFKHQLPVRDIARLGCINCASGSALRCRPTPSHHACHKLTLLHAKIEIRRTIGNACGPSFDQVAPKFLHNFATLEQQKLKENPKHDLKDSAKRMHAAQRRSALRL